MQNDRFKDSMFFINSIHSKYCFYILANKICWDCPKQVILYLLGILWTSKNQIYGRRISDFTLPLWRLSESFLLAQWKLKAGFSCYCCLLWWWRWKIPFLFILFLIIFWSSFFKNLRKTESHFGGPQVICSVSTVSIIFAFWCVHGTGTGEMCWKIV